MQVLIREGSGRQGRAQALAPLITPETLAVSCGFCTDDRNPLDIAEQGHIDYLVRTAIAAGVPLLHAYRTASWSAAQGFGLRDRGLIAPGKRADILLLEDLEACAVKTVITAGRILGEIEFLASPAPIGLHSVKLDPVQPDIFITPARGPTGPVIGIIPGKIVTEHLTITLPYRNGERLPDPDNDVLKLAVLARHGKNRNVGRGFVRGFDLRAGALASSVGHDSHNICVTGSNNADMALATNRLIALGGGFVATMNGAVIGEMALPMAGLISLKSFPEVRAELQALRHAVASMGCRLAEPFLQLAFLPLPVIPHLKITDMGMVDVDRFELIAA